MVKSILESGHASSKSKSCPEVARLLFKSLSSFNCKNKENLKIKSNYYNYSIIGLNNVLLSTLFIVFNDAKQYCGAGMI